MIRGVIFDLDGVLVSTDELHYLAWKQLADELGITAFTKEDNKRQRGVSRMASLEVVLEKGDKTYTDEEKVELATRKNNYYLKMLDTLTKKDLLAGARETLLALHERGVLTGLGSASKNAPVILEKTGILPLFDKISCGLDTTKSKPDPEVFLVAAKKLGLPPEECLVVEDSQAGIDAAKAGGMKSLAVGPLYQTMGADYCARDLADNVDWDTILNA